MEGGPGTIVLDELVEELARVVWQAEVAQVLVLSAGFPAQDLPSFTTPRMFWSFVIWGAVDGKVVGGVKMVADRAAKAYPANEVFAAYRDAVEGGPEVGRRLGAMARLRREIIDFATERGRHKHFFGREDVLGEMDAWVRERDGGWLMITGSPGLGKSALMDRWLRRREATGSLTAFHFIRRGHLDWAEPQVVQRNLAAQLEVMFPGQRDPEADPMYRLEQLLGRVGPVLVERDHRLVLLVDGLDEAMALGTGSKDNPIPRIFPLELPERVFVVTASRPRYPHLDWLEQRNGPFEHVPLDARVASNEGAVRAYWTALGPTMSPPLASELVEAAIRGAEGNLLHAVKLRELWSRPGVERVAKAVPHGFPGMVDELWQRTTELPEGPRKRVRDGLALVCAARQSLPLRVVEELLDWPEDTAGDEFLPLAREMLLEESWDQVPAYRPFHESLRELVERKLAERKGASKDAFHRRLAEYAAWPVEEDEFRRGYALRHRVEHRVDVGDSAGAAKACVDLGYLTAKACAEGVDAVERDVGLAAGTQSDRAVRERLQLLGRLIVASSHWAREVPEAFPALLHDRALTHAPDLLRDLVGPAHPLLEHPRLRHPLTVSGMSRILQGHKGSVRALAMLPDGRVVSGSRDKTVRVWNVATGRAVATLQGHASWVNALAVLPDGRVVSGSEDETVRVWDVATGRAVTSFQGHTSPVNALAVLPDGRVVSGSSDGTVHVWDIATGRAVATLQGHTSSVNALAVLPDGRVVSGSGDGAVRVWDVATGRAVATLQGHTSLVMALAVLPDGRVVSGSGDGTVRVWDVATRRAVATLQGHTSSVDALAVLPDGRVVSGSDDKTLRVWDVLTGRAVATLQGHQSWVMALAVLPDGRVVSGSDDKTVRAWDVATERAVATLQGHTSSVNGVVVLPDGRVVSGSDDKTLRVWDVATGRAVATLQGHTSSVMTLAVLPDGRVLSGSSDKTLRAWDVATGRAVATLQGHTSSVMTLAVLPDGRVLSGSSDGMLRVWDVATERAIATLQGHQGWVMALVVLPDGRVVSGSSDGMVRVWDVATGRAVSTLQGHKSSVNALTVMPDGRVVSGSGDGTVRVWDVATGRAVVTLQGHKSWVMTLGVLPDGRVVSGSYDKTLRVWDVATGRTITTIYGDASFYRLACVDQHLIVAGDAIGNVCFIELPDLG